MSEYTGPERRRVVPVDDTKLDADLEEVRRLHGKTTELAEAVSRTVPREEVEAREHQFKWILIGLAVASLVCMMMIPLLTRAWIATRFDRLDRGQKTTQCLQAKPEAERTGTLADTALLTCSQRANR